ncbi:hypothetical protein DWV24_22205 [Bacteroides thetaiotaomicron]|nr:hypothetical protein DWV24_22205 [Bacteroides thetaiotaomicron]
MGNALLVGENGKMRRFFVCIEEESFFIEREAFFLCEGGLHDTRVSVCMTPGCQDVQHPGVSMLDIRVSYRRD